MAGLLRYARNDASSLALQGSLAASPDLVNTTTVHHFCLDGAL